MIIQHQSYREIENLNNLLILDIDHVELLNYDFHQTLYFPRNIISFVLKADNGNNDYYEDIAADKKLVFEPGYILFLPLNTGIRFERSLKTKTITLHFALEFIFGMDVFVDCKHCVRVYDPASVNRIQQYLVEPDKLRASCGIRQELLNFCYRFWPERINLNNALIYQYEDVLNYTRAHCNAQLTVATLAEMKHQRQEVFSRNFKKALGQSPHAFIQKILIQKISSMLLGPASIKEIAEELKFSSEFYLSRFFAKHIGIPPKQFKIMYGNSK